MKNNFFRGNFIPSFFLLKGLFLFFIFILTACSYSVYSGRFPNLKTIRIEQFENKTTEYNINEELLDDLSKDFINDGRLKLVDKNPDSILKGKILKYKNDVYTYENETIKQYKLEITFEIEFNNLIENKPIWTEKNLVLSKIYENKQSTDLKEAEENARKEIFDDLFQKILSNTLEEW